MGGSFFVFTDFFKCDADIIVYQCHILFNSSGFIISKGDLAGVYGLDQWPGDEARPDTTEGA